MGFSIGDVTRAVQEGEHELAHAIVGQMERTGHAAAATARQILNRLPGGMKLGNKAFGSGALRTPKLPFKPGEMQAPHPGDFKISSASGNAVCSSLSKWGGGQPFTLVGFKSLAAGAQTQGTDLVDFHASASNPTVISTNDIVPGNVEIYEASLYITARLVTTLGFEGAGFLNSLWLVEYINGIEKARWSIKKLAAMIGATGLVSSGATSSNTVLDLPAIPWRRSYDPNIPAKTTLQCSVTTTTVSALDCCFVEDGIRP